MTRDPIVEEIHRTRKKMLEECGGDFDKLFDRLMAAQEKEKGRLGPKPPRPKKRAASPRVV